MSLFAPIDGLLVLAQLHQLISKFILYSKNTFNIVVK